MAYKSLRNSRHWSDMHMDNVELINEIMIRPEIWMSRHPANKNKWKTLRKWDEIKTNKFPLCSVDDLKKRWKNIKDQYRKELKKLPQAKPGVPVENITSNWKYFEYLAFMKDELLANRETDPDPLDVDRGESSNTTQDYKMAEEIEIKAEQAQSPQPSDPKSDDDYHAESHITSVPINKTRGSQPPKEMREELLKIEQRKLQILESEVAQSAAFMKSDNYQFLMSLLPEMEKLPSVHKMRLRMKISQAVLDEVSSYEQQKFNNQMTHIQDNALNDIAVEIKEEPINMYD